MTNILDTKIAELAAQKLDTALEDAKIKAMEADLNRAIGVRNEKLHINASLDKKIQDLMAAKVLLTEEELESMVEETPAE